MRALTDVERAMLSDRQNGGLSIDTRSVRNEFDMGQPEGKTAGGVALYEILYRHAPNDPRSRSDNASLADQGRTSER